MIVISPALALTLAGTLSANNPLVGYRNLVTFSGVEADSEDADYPATNLANPSTNRRQGWESATTDEQYLTFTVASEDAVDYVGIARHNFGSGGVTVSVEYPDPDNPGDWLELIPPFLPADDAPLLLRFVPIFLTSIRVRLQPVDIAPRAAVAYVGALLVMQRRIYVGHVSIVFGRATNVQSNWSEGGDYLGSVLINEKRATSFPMANLTPEWVRASLKPFLATCRTVPWFWAWRPEEYPLEVGYVVCANDPTPVNQRNNGMMSVDFQVSGIAP